MSIFYRTTDFVDLIEKDDFGIITERNDLENLDVLVLEVNEKYGHKIDEDVLTFLWEKWFKEMNVGTYAVYRSDLPAYTRTRIENFFNEE